MGNEFYQGYKEIRERVVREPNRFFEKKNILVNGRSFNVYQFNFDEDMGRARRAMVLNIPRGMLFTLRVGLGREAQ